MPRSWPRLLVLEDVFALWTVGSGHKPEPQCCLIHLEPRETAAVGVYSNRELAFATSAHTESKGRVPPRMVSSVGPTVKYNLRAWIEMLLDTGSAGAGDGDDGRTDRLVTRVRISRTTFTDCPGGVALRDGPVVHVCDVDAVAPFADDVVVAPDPADDAGPLDWFGTAECPQQPIEELEDGAMEVMYGSLGGEILHIVEELACGADPDAPPDGASSSEAADVSSEAEADDGAEAAVDAIGPDPPEVAANPPCP